MPWQTLSTIRRVGHHAGVRRQIGAALLLGLALTVAACGASTAGSAQPTPTPTQAPVVTPTSTPTPQACTEWRVVASPNVIGTGYWVNELYAVSALSPTAAWAVGVGNQELSDPQSLIEQWDGTKWRIIPNSGGDVLKGVAAISPRDVWAVGGQLPLDAEDYHPHNPLIMHWDGTRWSSVPSPSPGGPAELAGAVALAANDVWAVGAVEKDTSASHAHVQPLIEHWDGTAWHIVSSPAPNGGRLRAVATIPGTRQLWAVGYTANSAGSIYDQQLIERWDGRTWQVVTGPHLPLGATGMELQSVVALSATDAWAVGSYSRASGSRNLFAHWNGATWSVDAIPAASAPLAGVAAAGPRDVRAVGWIGVVEGMGATMHAVIEQWDGAIWHIVASPDPGATSGGSQLNGITSDGAGNYWAVGSYYKEGLQTLTLRCS